MANTNDIITEDYTDIIYKTDIVFPMIVIYRNTLDYPGYFVSRLWNINKPTQYMNLAESLDTICSNIPAHMVRLNRQPNDDPCIIEKWI